MHPVLPSRAIILDCARFSKLAYKTPDEVKMLWELAKKSTKCMDTLNAEMLLALQHVPECPVFLNDCESDAQGYGIVYDGPAGEHIIISFRGTSTIADALTDACIRQVPLICKGTPVPPAVKVHRGFLNQFQRVEGQCDEFLRKVGVLRLVDDDMANNIDTKSDGARIDATASGEKLVTPRLIFTGHSLGTLSCIGALIYALQLPAGEVGSIMFGGPRVGSEQWANLFNEKVRWHVRCKHGRDPIVSIIPPICYRHVGDKSTYMHVGRSDPFPELALLTDLVDHDCVRYIQELQKPSTSETPHEFIPFLLSLSNIGVRAYNFVKEFHMKWINRKI